MLAEAASLEKQVVKAESTDSGSGSGGEGDTTVSETTVIVRSTGENKKADREKTADAIATLTGDDGGVGGGGGGFDLEKASTAAAAMMAAGTKSIPNFTRV